MEDRVKINNGKSSIIKVPSDYAPADFAEFLTDLKSGMFADISPNNSLDSDAGVTVVGTPLNKANMLTDTTANRFGLTALENPTVDSTFEKIADKFDDDDTITTITLLADGWSEVTGQTGKWVQNASIPTMKADTNPSYQLVPDDTLTAQQTNTVMSQFACISKMETFNGYVQFTVCLNVPTYDLTVKIKGV